MSGQDDPGPARPPGQRPDPTRDISTGIMAVVAVVVFGFGCWATANAGGWWWVLFAVFVFIALSCAYGVGESFQKVPRDAKGNRIK